MTESSETKEYTACFACANGLYGECMNLQPIEGDPDHFLPCFNRVVAPAVETEKRGPGRPVQTEFATEKRAIDTGRKRAAMLYPITDDMVCEWAGLKYAGGGVETVVGCRGNKATHRHHGADKSVLNNSPGNVHRICATCHVHFHALNDKYYGERPEGGKPFLPIGYEVLEHDPNTKATEEELENNERWWATQPEYRATED